MRNSRVVYDRKNSSFYTLKRGMVKWEKVLADAAVFHCSGITCAISRDAMESTMDAIKLAGYISSSVVRQIASLGSDVSNFVPPNVVKALKHRFS